MRRNPRAAGIGLAAAVLTVTILFPDGADARRGAPPPGLRAALPSPEVVTLAPVDVGPYRAEDAVRDRARIGPVRFAVPVPVSIDPVADGTWARLEDGRWSWRVRIRSAGALSLNLALRRVSLPSGAALWLHDGRGRVVQGPFTAADLTPAGELWTPVVLGEEAVLEAVVPEDGRDRFWLEVFRVHHGYRFFGEARQKSGACNVDVVCPEGDPWRDQIRSVGWYTLEGWGTCSGYLVNNVRRDGTPYFVTADHCGVREGNAATMVFYWNYESPSCGQHGGGTLEDTQSGAIFRMTYGISDTTLVELQTPPDPSFDLFLMGFDATGTVPSQGTVSVHHPNLDEKSISIDYDPPTDASTHWRVVWDVGTTEPGSSGSLLFDRGSGLAIGMLTGGTASCSNPSGYDEYGKIAVAWNGGGSASNSLAPWLDPDGTGTLTVQGMNLGGERTWWLPIVAGLPGSYGSDWRTDVVLLAPGPDPVTATLHLRLDSGLRTLQRQVPAGGQLALEDVVGTVGATGKGPLEIAADGTLMVTARVYNRSSGGTFGQYFVGWPKGSGLTAGQSAWLPGLRQEAGLFRTNLLVTNTGGSPATVRVTLRDAAGNQLVSYDLTVPAGGMVQDLEPFAARAGRSDLGWGFAEVEVLSGSGLLVSASVVDSRTNDATTVEAHR